MSDGREDGSGEERMDWASIPWVTEDKEAPAPIPWWILLVIDVVLSGASLFHAVQGHEDTSWSQDLAQRLGLWQSAWPTGGARVNPSSIKIRKPDSRSRCRRSSRPARGREIVPADRSDGGELRSRSRVSRLARGRRRSSGWCPAGNLDFFSLPRPMRTDPSRRRGIGYDAPGGQFSASPICLTNREWPCLRTPK